LDYLPPEVLLNVEAEDVGKRGAVPFEKGVKAVAKDVLHAHAPSIRPEFSERIEKARRSERDLVVADLVKRVVSKGLGLIGGVEIDETVAEGLGGVANALRQISVRVYQRKASAGSGVLAGERL
jgi:hypothetical protein